VEDRSLYLQKPTTWRLGAPEAVTARAYKLVNWPEFFFTYAPTIALFRTVLMNATSRKTRPRKHAVSGKLRTWHPVNTRSQSEHVARCPSGLGLRPLISGNRHIDGYWLWRHFDCLTPGASCESRRVDVGSGSKLRLSDVSSCSLTPFKQIWLSKVLGLKASIQEERA
jgi:hypothetical protein